MSNRLGSNINSPLFMIDPVPVRNDKVRSDINSRKQSFFVKGEDTTSYEHVGGQDDVFIITSPDGSFQLHRTTLKETLVELKTQSHVSIRQLSPEHTESFKSIVEALRLLYGSQALYELILTDIHAVFDDVKDIIPGTIAAFFIGCSTNDKFPGPMGCSPKCAASLPPSDGTPGYTNCDDLVLIYSEGLFSSLNDKRSTHAYIYIGESNFLAFSPENIRQLRDAGIENASLVFGLQDGSYREVTSVLPVDKLPYNSAITSANLQQTPDETATNTTNSGAGIAFAIIIVVIIILLLVLLYRSNMR